MRPLTSVTRHLLAAEVKGYRAHGAGRLQLLLACEASVGGVTHMDNIQYAYVQYVC